jgi:putrescine transport system substrate-binding protein
MALWRGSTMSARAKRGASRRLSAALALALCASPACAAEQSPFAPPPKPEARFIRVLAFADYFDADALAEFERDSGRPIAYDAYGAPDDIAAKLREGSYDLVVLPGPVLHEEIAAGGLQKIDKTRLKNIGDVAPRVMAKLAAYDSSGAYALPYMWFATGLLLDTEKTQARIGAGAVSWGVIFSPNVARRFADCGVATPNDRDDMFMAVWRYLGLNPARLGPVEMKRAGDTLLRLKAGARAFSAPDVVGALANGSACVSVGGLADARRAMERAKQGGQKTSIRFVIPKEGAPMSIDAFAIPKNAPHVEDAYALLDFLLRHDIAARNARVTGVSSGEDGGSEEDFKRLSPAAAVEPAVAAQIEKEWTRVKSAK